MNSKNDQESNKDFVAVKVRVDDRQRNRILINPPPDDMCCEICGRNVDELEPYTNVPKELEEIEYGGGSIQYVTKDHKLMKNFREFYPGYIGASWECKECTVLSTEDAFDRVKKRSKMH